MGKAPVPPESPSLAAKFDMVATEAEEELQQCADGLPSKSLQSEPPLKPQDSTYNVARDLFLRAMGLMYVLAFLVALEQNDLLIGSNGLTPGPRHLRRLRGQLESRQGKPLEPYELYLASPTVLWFAPEGAFDEWLLRCEVTGLGLALIPLLFGRANMVIMAAIWVLYGSITNVGQGWYSFGWEIQLLETGFLSIFLCPFMSLDMTSLATPKSVVWLYRWLLMRIYIGAGLIKLRGDSCWRDFSCMNYFYETTCVPNPLSWFFHTQFPAQWHIMEVTFNHIVQVCVPWTMLLSREVRMLGAVSVASEMLLIQATGNYGFLNMMTILPAIFCFDDEFFSDIHVFVRLVVNSFYKAASGASILSSIPKISKKRSALTPSPLRQSLHVCLILLISFLSVPVVMNLLSPSQRMNTSFNTFSIVNTYGAFGSVNRERHEVILFGSASESGDEDWLEYQFKCKPGDTERRPCILAPYHFRIDWALWFAGFQPFQYHPWLVHYIVKLLEGDELAFQALAENPFTGKAPPKRIKVDKYHYRFAREWNSTAWWVREFEEPYLPPLSLDQKQVYDFLRSTDLID
mmetsp:Transcript_20348/g.39983  ORF Transcript_20348/g.39983 Transcript_20348/m.39983 type:complete len:574 (+) Transcript_20348:106-1827(+)